MRFPLSLTSNMIGYMAGKTLAREKRYPLVLMLEPLHACNLTCTGCGRIREYSETIKDKLSVEECLASVDEAGAPIVSICGGEPMIYPEIGRAGARHPASGARTSTCAPTACSSKDACTNSGRPAGSSSTSTSTASKRRTTWPSSATGVFKAAVEGIKCGQGGRLPRLHQHHDLQGNQHRRDRSSCSPT